MERWRVPLLFVSALAAVAMLLAWLLDPRGGAATAPVGATSVQPALTKHVDAASGAPVAVSTASSAPAPSNTAELIAAPYDPPKPGTEGARDDFIESGLPRALWDLWTGLLARGPTEKHLASAESLLKRPLTDAEKKSLTDTFAKNDERAQLAIGKYRQKLWTEDQTATQIRDAASAYRKKVMELLKLTEQEFDQVFGK